MTDEQTAGLSNYLASDALISPCGMYRYWLSRRLSMGERTIVFVGLNPSTADAQDDDPTIRRCVGFARREGFDWLYMANLHAYRSTDPKALRGLDDIEAVGPENQEHLRWMTQRAEVVVAAWGANPLGRYARTLADRIKALPNARHLGLTADGSPKHPLYLAKTTPLGCFTQGVPHD